MPWNPAWFVRAPFVGWLLFQVAAQTSPAALVLNDPLQGWTIGTRSGGAFVSGGWQVTSSTDTIYWHVPTITNGAAEFDVRGLYPNECRTGMEDKIELWHMYDFTFGNADVVYAGGYRDDPFKHFIRKTDCLDAARVNSMEIVWQIAPNFAEPDTAALVWDPNTTYHFLEEWGTADATNSVLKVFRDGALLLTTAVPGVWKPLGHSVRIAASPRRAADFGAPLGAIFSQIKVWDLAAGPPEAPIITLPASNAVLNTTSVFVQWSGDPHTRYQVRITTLNDSGAPAAWDSGLVTSDRNFAWTGVLPDSNTYYAFVRLATGEDWGSILVLKKINGTSAQPRLISAQLPQGSVWRTSLRVERRICSASQPIQLRYLPHRLSHWSTAGTNCGAM